MVYVELFAGVGGFRLGIERAFGDKGGREQPAQERQHEQDNVHPESIGQSICVFSNEWDKYAAQTYNKNFGGSIDTRSVTDISTVDFPDHDLLVGGFPCQAFSVAGKRAGFNETRGTLFFEIARILADKKPQHLLLENVKGLLSHDSGATFQTILGVLADLGYGVEWQVLNSKDFGVPQNRERVFIIGHLGACCGRQVFPVIGTSREDISPPRQPQRVLGQQDMYRHLTNTHVGQQYGWEASGGDKPQEPNRATRQPLRFLERNQKNIEGDYAYTVDSTNTGGVAIANRIRRLTPVECERLQGFPDGWTEGVSDTQRYKQMGNAVTVNVIEAIVKALYL